MSTKKAPWTRNSLSPPFKLLTVTEAQTLHLCAAQKWDLDCCFWVWGILSDVMLLESAYSFHVLQHVLQPLDDFDLCSKCWLNSFRGSVVFVAVYYHGARSCPSWWLCRRRLICCTVLGKEHVWWHLPKLWVVDSPEHSWEDLLWHAHQSDCGICEGHAWEVDEIWQGWVYHHGSNWTAGWASWWLWSGCGHPQQHSWLSDRRKDSRAVARGGIWLVPPGWFAPWHGQSHGIAKDGWRWHPGAVGSCRGHLSGGMCFCRRCSGFPWVLPGQPWLQSPNLWEQVWHLQTWLRHQQFDALLGARWVHVPDAEVQRVHPSGMWPQHDPSSLLLSLAWQACIHPLWVPRGCRDLEMDQGVQQVRSLLQGWCSSRCWEVEAILCFPLEEVQHWRQAEMVRSGLLRQPKQQDVEAHAFGANEISRLHPSWSLYSAFWLPFVHLIHGIPRLRWVTQVILTVSHLTISEFLKYSDLSIRLKFAYLLVAK